MTARHFGAMVPAADGSGDVQQHDFRAQTAITAIGSRFPDGKRAAFLKRPLLHKVASAFQERIAAEERRDHDLRLGALRMRADGLIHTIGADGPVEAVRLTRSSFGQLGQRAGWPAGGTPYLMEAPAGLRAQNVNHWIEASAEAPIKMRTRTYDGERESFAIVTPRYQAYDAADLFAAVKAKLPSSARGAVSYDGSRAELEATFMDLTVDVRALKVGDAFSAGIRVRTSDDGTGGFSISGFVGRLACNNGLILDAAIAKWRSTHLRRSIVDDLADAIERSAQAVGDFPRAWSAAAEDQILDAIHGSYDAEPIFRALVDGGHVEAPTGTSDDDMVTRLVSAYQIEPGGTRADLINAITRAAHMSPWHDPWTQTALEERAGQMLYQTVSWSDGGLRIADLDLN